MNKSRKERMLLDPHLEQPACHLDLLLHRLGLLTLFVRVTVSIQIVLVGLSVADDGLHRLVEIDFTRLLLLVSLFHVLHHFVQRHFETVQTHVGRAIIQQVLRQHLHRFQPSFQQISVRFQFDDDAGWRRTPHRVPSCD